MLDVGLLGFVQVHLEQAGTIQADPENQISISFRTIYRVSVFQCLCMK